MYSNLNLSRIRNLRFEIRCIIWLSITTGFGFLLLLLFIKLKLSSKEFIDDPMLAFCIFTMCFIAFPKLGDELKIEFVKSPSTKVILIPLLAAPLLHYIISFSRYIPCVFGGNVIPIGSNQVINTYPMFSFPLFFYNSLFPGINEELLFRFLPYVGLKIFLESVLELVNFKKSFKNFAIKTTIYNFLIIILKPFLIIHKHLYIKKNRWFIALWIIIISIIFSAAHGPSVTSFYIYFLSSVLFTICYLRYGLLSSIIAHMANNYFSPVTHLWAINTFYFLFPFAK